MWPAEVHTVPASPSGAYRRNNRVHRSPKRLQYAVQLAKLMSIRMPFALAGIGESKSDDEFGIAITNWSSSMAPVMRGHGFRSTTLNIHVKQLAAQKQRLSALPEDLYRENVIRTVKRAWSTEDGKQETADDKATLHTTVLTNQWAREKWSLRTQSAASQRGRGARARRSQPKTRQSRPYVLSGT